MRDILVLFIHLITTAVRALGPGGVRSVVAESLLLRHQLLILNRSRIRAPSLFAFDRIFAALCACVISPARLLRLAIVLKPSTLLSFHRALVKRKYQRLFSSKHAGKPGPKGPAQEIIAAIVEMKKRNPRFGYRRIAEQLVFVFGIEIDKDVVRRVLAKYYRPEPGSNGPSWLTVIGHSKDSLWSVDLFRCESLLLKTHWIMVVMDQFTRRIIGFIVCEGAPDGPAVCRLFNEAVTGSNVLPRYLSSDNDPLFHFHRWKANLRILDVTEIKTVLYTPVSHPFVERIIGTVRREYLDHVPFWNSNDLRLKLNDFKDYYNRSRVHRAIEGTTPVAKAGLKTERITSLSEIRWEKHCRGLFQLPIAI